MRDATAPEKPGPSPQPSPARERGSVAASRGQSINPAAFAGERGELSSGDVSQGKRATGNTEAPKKIWPDALLAARLLATDPHGFGGAVVRSWPGPVRDRWLDALRAALPPG
ncbi:magnesium chelatase ATPase subunit D, partial [Methylobacterium sp. WL18]